MAATVDPLLPLSLLEAVRNVDTPQGDLEAEFVAELRNKRLGLSDTVHAQIKRYVDAVRRQHRPAHDEAVALARPLALRHARRIASRYFDGRIKRVGNYLMLAVDQSVTLDTAPRAAGCTYYEAGLRELLRLLIGGAGMVEHVRCASRGEGVCEWRAEWRPVDRK